MALQDLTDRAILSTVSRHLLGQLSGCPLLVAAKRIVIAYSGGLDSSVLLALLAILKQQNRLNAELCAMYVNHGLQAQAGQWQAHCQGQCEALGIELLIRQAHLAGINTPESLEEAARNARYAFFSEEMSADTVLVQGHHQDDQCETILYRLVRGSGVKGLGGIPPSRLLGKGQVVRPLLPVAREALRACAAELSLHWVEDPSNQSEAFDRNFLRHAVLPQINARWPGANQNLERSAQLCREAAELNNELAQLDLAQCATNSPQQLSLAGLGALSELRQRNVLYYWLNEQAGLDGGALISHHALLQISKQMIHAREDAMPCVSWGEGENQRELRRYRQTLYYLPGSATTAPIPEETINWQTDSPLQLPQGLGQLRLIPAVGCVGMRAPAHLTVRFRSGGEAIKLAKRPTRSVKKLLQEEGIVPWERDRLPLLYCDEKLLAIADLFMSEEALVENSENTVLIEWQRAVLNCG